MFRLLLPEMSCVVISLADISLCLHSQTFKHFNSMYHYVSESSRNVPCSVSLGCDTWPDVAAPLASRVSWLTDWLAGLWFLGTAEGERGRRQSAYQAGFFSSWVSFCHIALIKPPSLASLRASPRARPKPCASPRGPPAFLDHHLKSPMTPQHPLFFLFFFFTITHTIQVDGYF